MLKAKRKSFSFNLNFKAIKNPKVIGLILFFIILGALPVALYEVQQQQTNQQHAAQGCTPYNGTNWCEGNQHYTCDNGGIIVYINPVANTCTSTITSFQSAMDISAGGTNKGAYTIHWGWLSNVCTSGGICDQTNGTDKMTPVSGTLSGSSSTRAQSAHTSPPSPFTGQACGIYQNDFGFYVTRNSDGHQVCGISLGANLNITNNNATWCSVKACTLATPTPTHAPSPTPSRPPTATPTGGITATPTIPIDTPTDTPAPTASPSATPTIPPTLTPTGTLTPTATPTVTPTNNPTNTPPPGSTPTPTIIVVNPTLPPTGPGSTLLTVGLLGVAISVLGMALLLGF